MYAKGGKYYKKGLKKAPKQPKVTKAVKAYVDKAVVRKEEHKSIASSIANLSISTYNPSFQTMTVYDCGSALQSVLIGAGSGNRIGNQINVTSYIVRGFINIQGAPITTNVYIRMIVLRVKRDISTVNGSLGQLYQFGNNTLAPEGTLNDMMRAINKDFYTVYYSRQVLMGSCDAVTSRLPMNNSVGSHMFSFDLKKVFGGKIIYNDTATTPQNKSAYLLFVPCNADGTVLTNTQILPYFTSIDTEIQYTDA